MRFAEGEMTLKSFMEEPKHKNVHEQKALQINAAARQHFTGTGRTEQGLQKAFFMITCRHYLAGIKKERH